MVEQIWEIASVLNVILAFTGTVGVIYTGYRIWCSYRDKRRRVDALFVPPGERPSSDSAPSRFLREEFQIVDFRGREKEIADLTNWALHKVPTGKNVSIALVTGRPGRGKSRLARRLCENAKKWNSETWVTGFLEKDAGLKESAGNEDRDVFLHLMKKRKPVLAIVDYAERRTEQTKKLVSAALASGRRKHPVRVILIARAKNEEWWSDLEGAFDNCSINPFEDGQAKLLELAPIEDDPDLTDRHQEFNRAVRAFQKALGKEGAVEAPKDSIPNNLLPETQKVEVLDIHVAALLAAYGDGDDDGSAGQADTEKKLLANLVKREQKAWDQAIDKGFKGLGLTGKPIRRAIAWLATTDGLTSENDAVNRLFLLPSFSEDSRERREGIARIAAALYPGGGKEWWGGLAPDRLTTWLTHELDGTIEDDVTKKQPVVVADLPEDALANLLRHLTWRVQRYGNEHEHALANAIRAGGRRGIAIATKVGMETRDPIGRIAAEVLSDPENEEAAPEVVGLIGDGRAISLRELALAAAKIMYRNAATASDEERAKHASNLGFRLSGLGQSEEALAAIEESVAIRRGLAEARPDELCPGLAEDLNSLGGYLLGLGRSEEGLAAIEESVAIHRGLVEARSDEFRPDLAMSLSLLGFGLSALGRREEALVATKESVAVFRGLAKARRGEFHSGLAISLDNLSNCLFGLGRYEEALAAIEESVAIRRDLAEAQPDEFRLDLAMSLSLLGMCLYVLKRLEKAFMVIEESVAIYRDLAEARPCVFRPGLASSLSSLSLSLFDLGRHEEALTAIEESVAIYRDLAEARPGVFHPGLAMSLSSLSAFLSGLGRHGEALAAIEESVALRRDLAEVRPDEFFPSLAEDLNSVGGRLLVLGRREEALAAIEESVAIFRRLAKARPGEFRTDLATSLDSLSNCLSGLGRREEALAVLEESVAIRRDLAEARPNEFHPRLATSLNSLGICLFDLGRREEALTAIEESVAIHRDLKEARSDKFHSGLVMSLHGLRVCLSGLGRHEEALAAIEEAVAVCRDLAEAQPDVFRRNLAISLGVLSSCLFELERHEEASKALEEAIAIWPRIPNLLQELKGDSKIHRHNDQDSKP